VTTGTLSSCRGQFEEGGVIEPPAVHQWNTIHTYSEITLQFNSNSAAAQYTNTDVHLSVVEREACW